MDNCNNIIIVNATASRITGALTILRQFIDNIPDDLNIIVFKNPNVELASKSNVHYVPIDTVSWIKRQKWDNGGLQNWCKSNNISPSLIISLQNTGVKFDKNIPQLIYFHQVLTINDKRWNPFKSSERSYFFYREIYPWFIKQNLHSNTHFVVQIPSSKQRLSELLKIPKNRINVIAPDLKIGLKDEQNTPAIDDGFIHLLFPGAFLIYKNHITLAKALKHIKEIDPETSKRIRLHLTVHSSSFDSCRHLFKQYDILENISLNGPVPYEEMLKMYQSMHCLVYPSYIESFGLPLLEAAYFGMPIIASDLPYAHDVVGKYEGTKFINHKDPKLWANAILETINENKRYPKFKINAKGWKDFFDLVRRLQKS